MFLESTFDEQEVIDFLQRLVGYCLTGDTREHVLPIFWGGGSNGKSTFVEAILNVLGGDEAGSYAMKAPHDFLLRKRNQGHPTEVADLHGKRFVAAVETGQGRALNEFLVKELTGGDSLRARRMTPLAASRVERVPEIHRNAPAGVLWIYRASGWSVPLAGPSGEQGRRTGRLSQPVGHRVRSGGYRDLPAGRSATVRRRAKKVAALAG